MSKLQDQIAAIFEAWRPYQKRPTICRLTKERKDLIRCRLDLGYAPEDFVTLITYAYEAKTQETLWWQGDNPRRAKYLDLSNLLRKEKLAGRIERAWDWQLSLAEGGTHDDADEDLGLRLVKGGE